MDFAPPAGIREHGRIRHVSVREDVLQRLAGFVGVSTRIGGGVWPIYVCLRDMVLGCCITVCCSDSNRTFRRLQAECWTSRLVLEPSRPAALQYYRATCPQLSLSLGVEQAAIYERRRWRSVVTQCFSQRFVCFRGSFLRRVSGDCPAELYTAEGVQLRGVSSAYGRREIEGELPLHLVYTLDVIPVYLGFPLSLARAFGGTKGLRGVVRQWS